MGNLGLSEVLVIFAVALLVIGPRRMPEIARGLGEALRAFQEAMKGSSKRDGGD
jgi:TatA/E family protein of Tat protein translocase